MIDTSAIVPLREVHADSDGMLLLAFRLWRMTCDVIQHLTGENDVHGVPWRDVPHVESKLRRFGTADEFVEHVASRAIPRAAKLCFVERLTRPGDFLSSGWLEGGGGGGGSPTSDSSDTSNDSADDDERDPLWELVACWETLDYDQIPDKVLWFVVEGWLRMRLELAEGADDVLFSGYSVRFSARAFDAWFKVDVLPRAVANI